MIDKADNVDQVYREYGGCQELTEAAVRLGRAPCRSRGLRTPVLALRPVGTGNPAAGTKLARLLPE